MNDLIQFITDTSRSMFQRATQDYWAFIRREAEKWDIGRPVSTIIDSFHTATQVQFQLLQRLDLAHQTPAEKERAALMLLNNIGTDAALFYPQDPVIMVALTLLLEKISDPDKCALELAEFGPTPLKTLAKRMDHNIDALGEVDLVSPMLVESATQGLKRLTFGDSGDSNIDLSALMIPILLEVFKQSGLPRELLPAVDIVAGYLEAKANVNR